MKKTILLTSLIYFLSVSLWGQTIVTGNTTGIWNISGSPYIVTGHIYVVDSLIIEPGVMVKFQAGGWSINVGNNAIFAATGTPEQPIIFEPNQGTTPGSWDRISISESGTDDTLKNCIMRYGTNAIVVNNSIPVISDCEVYSNLQNGIFMYYEQSTDSISITYCKSHHNGGSGIVFYGFGKNGNATVVGDIYRCILFDNTAGGADIQTSTYWNWDQAYLLVSLTSCTITGNGSGVRSLTDRGLADAKICNCIVAFNKLFGIVNMSAGSTIGQNDITYSCFNGNSSGNFQGLCDPLTGFGEPPSFSNANNDPCDINFNIYVNPQFFDTANYNYMLNGNSKCINAGTAIIMGQYILDPNGTLPEIGAEFYPYIVSIDNISFDQKEISMAYPNPFSIFTRITYSVKKPGITQLTLYDQLGKVVFRQLSKNQSAGIYQFLWNGSDIRGNDQAPGIYFYRLRTDGENLTGKIIRTK